MDNFVRVSRQEPGTKSSNLKTGKPEYVMNLTAMISSIKRQPRYPEVGMILCHNGVVRGTSRSGQAVSAIGLNVDRNRLQEVLAVYKRRPGIVDIIVEIREGTLQVGEDIMAVAVAGDIRENVFPVLQEIVDIIKKNVVRKTEYFK